MATLTETAYYTRKGIKLLGFAAVALIVLKVSLGIFLSIWLAIFPPAPPPPTVAFGRLPKVKFPITPIASSSASYTYYLEIVEGTLPVAGKTLKVYFIPKPTPTFGAFGKMRFQANRLGFFGEPKKVPGKADVWAFDDTVNPLRHLEYDDTIGNFRVFYDYNYDLNLFAQKSFTNQAAILNEATAFFTNLGLLTSDLSLGNQDMVYFKLDIDRLETTSSLAEADAVAVSFNKAPVVSYKNIETKEVNDSYPIISADWKQGLVSVLFSGNTDPIKKVLEAKYYYTYVDFENWATYPTISLAAAYEDLKQGKAYVASLPVRNSKEISIRKVYLGYFDSGESQSYLQPVAVFSDEKGFVAYVPVISPDLTGE